MDRLEWIKPKIKQIYYLICSILVVLTLNCKMETVEGGRGSSLLNGLYKLEHSFYFCSLEDIFILVAFYVLIQYISRQELRYDRWIGVFSITLSILYVVSISYRKFDSTVFLFANSYQILLSAICIAGYYLLIYYSLCLLVICLEKNAKELSQPTTNDFLHRHFWRTAFLVIFFCWLPWIIMNYPGTSEPDSTDQIAQYLGDNIFTSHQPPLSTFIMGILFEIGEFIWDANFGFFSYILFQTLLGALIFSWSIYKIYELGIPCKYCLVGVLYYALFPMWGGLAQNHGKNLFYTEITILFLTYLVNIILKQQCEKKDSTVLIFTGLLASLLRNNGIYAVIPTIIILCFYLKNIDRKRMCFVVCATLFLYYDIVKILYPSIGIEDGSIQAALSIPFLQTARYVDQHSDEVTDYEKEVINAILDYDALKTYNPKQSNSVNYTYKNDDSKLPEYFKVWFQMFVKHPGSYISTFFNMGGGFLAPVYQNFPALTTQESEEYILDLGIDHVWGNKYVDLFVEIEMLSTEMPIIKYSCMAGAYTWITLICILLLLRKKIYGGIILFVPQLMNVLVCIASPTWHLRYALPVAAATPLMIGWTYYLITTKILNEK